MSGAPANASSNQSDLSVTAHPLLLDGIARRPECQCRAAVAGAGVAVGVAAREPSAR